MTVPAKKLRMFPLARIERGMEDNLGFCLSCGKSQEGCEPDASKYTCESCGEDRVYGAEQLFVIGRVRMPKGG